MHAGERDSLHPPAGTEMSSQAQSSVCAGEEAGIPHAGRLGLWQQAPANAC